MRFAYADPPYPGMARNYPEKKEIDHANLVSWLDANFPDGWAMSTASTTLQRVIALCPTDVRIMAWVKPFCSFKPGTRLSYAWEPVILRGGRRGTRRDRHVRDFVSCNIAMKKGLFGAKPLPFCKWVLAALNFQPGDEMVDLFPGTGTMAAAVRDFVPAEPFPEKAEK